jgi:nucleoside-diphosphate-sugar epimerase
LIALDNLVDLLVRVIDHPDAANQTFLAADGEDVSTADLVRRMGFALGRRACLLSVSPALLRSGASLLGKGDVAKILCGSLQIDIAKTRELLNWTPPVCVDEALRRALSWGDS